MKKNFLFYFATVTMTLIISKSVWARRHLPPIEDFEIETEKRLDPFFIDLIRNNQGIFLKQYLVKIPHLIQLHASESGRTMLHIAIEYEQQDIIDILLSIDNINPNARDNNGATPFLYAARQGSILSMEKLFTSSANKNDKDFFGLGGIHYNIIGEKANYNTIKYLIDKELNINEQDTSGATPLHYAVKKNIDLITLLFKLGADPNVPDNRGNRPMHNAALINHPAAITTLICYGGYINTTNRHGYKPLHYALAKNNFLTAQILINKGAEVNCTVTGKPFIFFIIENCIDTHPSSSQTFKLLLEKGMDSSPLIRTKQGSWVNAHEYAIKEGKPVFAELIRLSCNKAGLQMNQNPSKKKKLRNALPFIKSNNTLFF